MGRTSDGAIYPTVTGQPPPPPHDQELSSPVHRAEAEKLWSRIKTLETPEASNGVMTPLRILDRL